MEETKVSKQYSRGKLVSLIIFNRPLTDDLPQTRPDLTHPFCTVYNVQRFIQSYSLLASGMNFRTVAKSDRTSTGLKKSCYDTFSCPGPSPVSNPVEQHRE